MGGENNFYGGNRYNQNQNQNQENGNDSFKKSSNFKTSYNES